MTPIFRIVADGSDITLMINDRLILLRTSDKPGMESDEFELRIDDRDSAVTLPSRGASIEIYLGYAGSTLSREGRYVVDEVEVSGPPDTLVIRGKASDMVVRWIPGASCIAVENPGTSAATSAPIVANRLACAQWRRVQRPVKGWPAANGDADCVPLARARSRFSRRTAS